MKKSIAAAVFVLLGQCAASACHAESDLVKTQGGNELSLSFSSYLYEEPSIYVSTTGDKFGVNHTGTLLLNNDWYVREDARFAYGQVDYAGSGIQLGAPDWYLEVRGMVGRDLPVGQSVLSLFTGLGYRYLFNDVRGYSSTGSAGYRRESNYIYLPLGMTHRMPMRDGAVLATTFEFDNLLQGKQETRLSDLVGQNGFVAASDSTNLQNSGYGFRLSMMYEMSDWAFGPFLNTWHIAESEVTMQLITDAFGPNWVPMYEPENQTTEYGMRLMFRF